MGAQPEAMPRPELPSDLALRRRSTGAVLVTGSGPGALVLDGLTDAETLAVVGLTAALRTPGGSAYRAAPSARWPQVLHLIHEAAALLTPVGSATGQVVVLGEGPLPGEICRALDPIVGRVITEPEALLAPEFDPAIHTPDLVILPAVDAVTALSGRPWHGRGIPQLPVVVSGGRLSVGPLIRPGTGPCLTCLDLHRGARDPGWAPWLASRALRSDVDDELDALPELRVTAAALAALVTRGLLENQPLPTGVGLSLERPQPRVGHHLWTRHPSCCGVSDARVTMEA
ncbi:TOMM precursor leader peptide-binding protein [Flexivirga alba]|uniref:TOMM leader peptide-binding protein n=1 Tax=Flexivirga alba TaxID=702742 RepID=A0ABW2AFH5_9MICO